jgi:hypothetical protein
VSETERPHWLVRLAEYDRPWVGRVGLGLILIVWAFAGLVAFAASVTIGLVVLVAGGVFIGIETLLERKEGLAPYAFVWHTTVSLAAGLALVVIAIARWGTAGAAVYAVVGAWVIVWRLALVALWLRLRDDPDGAEP